MKIALSRYKYKGEVKGNKYVELPNGNAFDKTVVKFRFVYANLSQTINSNLNNLGNNENGNKLLASLDPRWKNYLNTTGSDKVSLDGTDYNISNVSLDDSEVVPVYRITINQKSSFPGGGY